MKKSKGFTLIELLGVIIVISILLLITIPIIGNIVQKAREGAFIDSAYGLMRAAEYEVAVQILDGTSTKEMKFTYPESENKLNARGEKPDAGEIIVNEEGNIALALWSDKVGKCAVKDYEEAVIRYDEYIIKKEDCKIGGTTEDKTYEMWDGWITLTLYYPTNSTERKWRLGSEDEVRVDGNLVWQDYTGPITIPLSRVEDVWISYKLKDETIVIPPAGRVLVDIRPNPVGEKLVSEVNIEIIYDKEATKKEYRVGNSGWMEYAGPFVVTENTIIEARAEKDDSVYDEEGNKIINRKAVGRDVVYIGNIGVEEEDLPAPTIERLDAIEEGEVARVKITYPEEAVDKIYKINYGIEEEYVSELSIKKYGTYIIAYYYDENGKRSKSSAIYINEPENNEYNEPVEYKPNPPRKKGEPIPEEPSYQIPAPTINVEPTTLAESVEVSVSAPANADRIYIKKGYGRYEKYTGSITIREKTTVYAYYITYEGERSAVAVRRINNIKGENKPYVAIEANPAPWERRYGIESVEITINSSEADKVEYSLNGVEYQEYTGPFEIRKNTRVYAKATNEYGIDTDYIDITNIGLTPPAPKEKLDVSIMVIPEPSITEKLVDKVKARIEYDKKATKKYYRIGGYGELQEYSGEFEVDRNTTIYAYAINENGYGEARKKIDNITTGISEPVIVAVPNNSIQASKVKVRVEYDRNASITRYSIGGGSLRDYVGEFEVNENTTIYAYSENELGQSSESSYRIENIVPEPPMLMIDQGDYFILYLNYPEGSVGREYKWKKEGEWKSYKEEGILLIKPQYKDKVIDENNNLKIQIINKEGELIDFRGDYYILDYGISDIKENIFMRWDRTTSPTPQIVADTIEPAREVNITILYDSSLILKQYKVVGPEGEIIEDWTSYKGVIKVDKKDTIIYARGQDEAEVWTNNSIYKVSNIDEEEPEITLVTDLESPTRKLGIRVVVTDDVKVGKVKWAKGIRGESYFANGGEEILNNSIVIIEENDYYTFYAEDGVGNKQVYTINVENIDLTPPIIEITTSPETFGIETNVTIDYGDSTIKEYKIGNSPTWKTYTETFKVTSYEVLENGLENEDKTVTIYAKGIDDVGNEIIVSKKIINLDLDMPEEPEIISSAGYATITSHGVELDATTIIKYDNRKDIKNYYSIDNGETWIEYTGEFELVSGTIMAKSVKKKTGLEVVVSEKAGLPADALGPEAYDGDFDTYSVEESGQGVIKVDSSMHGKKARIKFHKSISGYDGILNFISNSGEKLASIRVGYGKWYDDIYTIPEGTEKIMVTCNGGYIKFYEIEPVNEPVFSAENGYMLLHADPEKAIRSPYQMVSIEYFPTSVERLYKIGAEGEWKEYQDKAIWVNQGETIYAKGIDKYGNETRIVSEYTVNVSDALGPEAYDGDYATYSVEESGQGVIKVDSSMHGKKARIKFHKSTSGYSGILNFISNSGEKLASITVGYGKWYDDIYTIPEGTEKIMVTCNGGYIKFYEIEPMQE